MTAKRIINTWTTRQIHRMEELIKEGKELGCRVSWREHLIELGHSLHAVNTMASTIYKRLRAEEARAERRFLRQLANTLEDEREVVTRMKAAKQREVTGIVATSFPRPRALAVLIAEAELRSRVSVQGITAGLLGDPPQGKSALDKKRLGIVEEPRGPGAGHKIVRNITLATKPWASGQHSEPQ